MVDAGSKLRTPTIASLEELRAFRSRLERLAVDSDGDLRRAAGAVLRQLERTAPVSARSFDRVYYAVLRPELMLSTDRQRAEWREVKEISVTLYHALLRDFREQVRRRHHSHAGITESRHPHRGRHAASVLP